MPLPNFLVIGAAKAGTTSLYDWLRQHPDVFMPRLKEPRFFAWEGQPGRYFPIKSLEDYAALFSGVNGETAIGEASPDYLHAPAAAGRIRDMLPEARLIVALRDPVDRARSLYEMRLRRRGIHAGRSFREALAADPKLREGYHPFLEAYLGRFDRAAVRIVLFEDIAGDAAATVHELFGFLGVSPDFRPDTSTVSNPGGLPRSKALHALLTDRRMREIARLALPESLLDRVRPLRAANLKKQRIEAEDRAAGIALFRDDILRTQDLIGRDLAAWLRA